MAAEGIASTDGEDTIPVAWMPNSLGKSSFIKEIAGLACNMDEVDDLAFLEALQAKTEARIAALRKDRGFYGTHKKPFAREDRSPAMHEETGEYGNACSIDKPKSAWAQFIESQKDKEWTLDEMPPNE